MDEVYASLAYDGAALFRVPVCVSRALLVVLVSIMFELNYYGISFCTIFEFSLVKVFIKFFWKSFSFSFSIYIISVSF